MRRWLSRIAWSHAALVILCGVVSAQTEFDMEIRSGALFKIPIHVEDFSNDGGGAPVRFGPAEGPEAVLVRDLEYADFFTVTHGPAGGADATGPGAPTGTRAVASGAIRTSWGRPVLTGALRDAASGTRIFQNDYPLGNPPDRWAVHAFADDIVLYMTGEKGVAETRIAFVRDHGSSREIHLIDYDGMNERQLTRLGTIVLSPAWAPGPDRLAFTSFASNQRTVVGLALRDGKYWTVSPKDGMNASPCWSHDGRRIAFTRSVDGNAEIYLADAGGGNLTRLTFNPSIDTSPTFSPDGRQIAFTSDRSGSPQVYVMNADGGNTQRMTFAGKQNDSPDWSPKGDRIAYVSLIDNVFDICTMRADGGDVRRLTQGDAMYENPRWAPDGRHVVYARKQGSVRRIYIMASDGSGNRALTGGNGAQYNPAWSPAWGYSGSGTEDR